MVKIGLISDTHAYIDNKIISYLEPCNEIWHAGDIGSIDVLLKLKSLNKTLRIVHGNVDSHDLILEAPENQIFNIEDLKVIITHIGGAPNKYSPKAKLLIEKHNPDIFICGHSHILKIINDKDYNLLHLNPGAIGIYGLHKVRTMLRFSISEKKVHDMEIIEINKNAPNNA